MEQTKVIDILDPQKGIVKETVIENKKETPQEHKPVLEALGLSKYKTFQEAATTSEFPTLLLSGLKQILFENYEAQAVTYPLWALIEQSDKQAEDWLEMNSFGVLPIVPESAPYPKLSAAIDRAVRVANSKRGAMFEITREMIRFEKANQMKQYARDLGVAAKVTEEATAYNVLTTSTNYTRNSTTGDNDVGANTAATTFSASGLVTALGTLMTMKDRKSGRYLNVNPSTLLVTPLLQFAAKQLVLATDLQIPGDGVTAAKVYGTGSANPFRGMINQIIVSPWVGTSYEWVLMEPKKPVVFQVVDPINLLIETYNASQLNEAQFVFDIIRYRVDTFFGSGMINDRFGYLSTSTTAPAIA